MAKEQKLIAKTWRFHAAIKFKMGWNPVQGQSSDLDLKQSLVLGSSLEDSLSTVY